MPANKAKLGITKGSIGNKQTNKQSGRDGNGVQTNDDTARADTMDDEDRFGNYWKTPGTIIETD